jgi:cell pole-organizing protein PopZ
MRTIFVLAFVVACGSKQPAPTGPATGSATEQGEGSAAHPMEMPSEMQAFHDLLAPRWHAAQGAQRMKDTCDAVPQFQSSADAIGTATPPTTANADTWTTATRALAAAVGELATACQGGNMGTFETAFTKVHEAFHALMAAAGAHEGDEAHEHHAM